MRNLKKVLALVLAFSMMFSVVAFANYADVDANADYAGAVELLSALDIIKGDDLGNFNPDNTITRAEYAAVVCRALGLENAANGAKGATQFVDVAADHWASGYINLATQNGIINGYGDGNFGPEDKVTYEQAVKMLVCALGFEPMAATKGGYPTGYLVVANQYKITAGVTATAEAPRKTVAQLVYNALSTPKMDQTSYGTDQKYEVLDGKNDRDYATLLTDMNIYIATGVVGEKDGEDINFALTENSDDYEFGMDGEKRSDGYANVTTDLTFKINGSDIEKYEHQNVDVYVEKVSGKYYVLAVVAADIGETFDLLSDDIKSITNNGSSGIEIEYYDENNKTKTVKLDANATIQFNKNTAVKNTTTNAGDNFDAFKAVIWDTRADESKDDIELVLVENTGDSKYDTIVATQYFSTKVSSVEESKDKLVTDDGTITFKFDDEDVTTILEDVNGKAIELKDFAEDDVVAVVADTDDYSSFKNFTKYIRVINLGDNSVTGTVTSTSTKNGNKMVTIDGKDYIDSFGLAIDDEGTFYIGMTGKIIDFDGSAASKNYGFILEYADGSSSFDDGKEVKLLTEKDGVVTYTFTSSANDAFKKYITDNFGGAAKKLFGDFTDNKDTAAARLISFKTNAKGEIKEIKKAEGTLNDVKEDKYKDSTQIIAKKTLEDDVIIFNLDKAEADDVYAADISYLVDDAEYTGYILNDKDGENSVFVITDGGTRFSDDVGLAIVTGIADKKDADGQDIKEVSYVQGEEEGTVIFDDDSNPADKKEETSAKYKYHLDDLDVGSVFAFNASSDGTVSDYVVIGKIVNGILDADTKTFGEFSEDNEFIFGYIANEKRANTTKGETVTIKGKGSKGAAIEQVISVSKSTSNRYTYNDANSRNIVIDTEDFMSEDTDYYTAATTDKNGKTVPAEATFVFVRVVSGSVVDIYSFNKRVQNPEDQQNGFYVNIDDPSTSVTTVTKPVEVPAKAEDVVDVVEDADIPAVEID